MKPFLAPALGLAFCLSMTAASSQAATIADWTFETSVPTTAGSFAPEVGAGSALGFHAGAATYSSPVGNGSSHSFSSNTWAVGDYYQFQVSTLGMNSVGLSWDQTGSSTGPKDFRLAYSTDGSTFTNVGTYSLLVNGSPNSPWSSTGSPNVAFSFTRDLSGITALDNQSNVYFRLIDKDSTALNGGTVASAGTDRVDNFTVTGVAAVPEPETYALFLAGLGLLGVAARRRNG